MYLHYELYTQSFTFWQCTDINCSTFSFFFFSQMWSILSAQSPEEMWASLIKMTLHHATITPSSWWRTIIWDLWWVLSLWDNPLWQSWCFLRQCFEILRSASSFEDGCTMMVLLLDTLHCLYICIWWMVATQPMVLFFSVGYKEKNQIKRQTGNIFCWFPHGL